MKTIQLSKGKVALVSDEDFESLSAFKWHLDGSGYPSRNIGSTKMRMHRQIIEGADVVDHVNGNQLDNTRENLRACDRSQNQFNRPVSRHNRCGLKGVSYHTKTHRWFSRIKYYGRQVHLGYFDTPELAHEFYCLAAIMVHGEFAAKSRIVTRRINGGE